MREISLASHALRVLVIEDNVDGRESLCMLLQVWGYVVETAEDGLEGLRKLLEWHPDVAVVDIGLPKLNGYQVARGARSASPQTHLIAYTGYASSEDRQAALDAGFETHLAKASSVDRLHDAIERCH